MPSLRYRLLPLSEALFVTFLWSTSYILVEVGLEEINPLAFAAYRYTIASAVLLLFALHRNQGFITRLSRRQVITFLSLGLAGYFVAQGLNFVGLYYLQPTTVSFILNMTPILVLAFSVFFLRERPSSTQLMGIAITLFGVMVFFYGSSLILSEVTGILVTFVSGVGWAAYMIISRFYLREKNRDVVVLTACSMALGSLMLLGVTGLTGNIVVVSLNSWLIVLWLGLANTALAFALWNHALKSLRAYEQSILQNTMLIQIVLLSNIFLNEQLVLQKILGLIVVFIGVLIVQIKPR